MAEKTAEKSAAAPASSGKLKIIGIAVFVLIVVGLETVFFFTLVPSGDEVAALLETRLIEAAEVKHLLEENQHDDDQRVVEYELGDYAIPFIPTGSDRQHLVEFRLYGTLQAKDLPRLKDLYAQRRLRFRDSLIIEIRNATTDELNENQLGLIRRRILAKSTELLGEAILLNVGFHDYQVIEN